MRLTLTFLFLSLSFYSYSQVPDKEWARCYGATGSDGFMAMEATPDSGFVLCGASGEAGVPGFYIVKVDRRGNVQWHQRYGNTADSETAFSITAAHDGGYIVVGEYFSMAPADYYSSYLWVVRLDASGNMVWNKKYGGSGQDFALNVTKTFDGNYIVSGVTHSPEMAGYRGEGDFLVMKINGAGDVIWQKTMGGSGADYGPMKVKETPGHDLVLLGFTTSDDGDVSLNRGLSDMWLVKLDPAGNLLWEKTYGGSGSDMGYDFLLMDDGSLAVLGQTNSVDGDLVGTNGGEDFWFLRLGPDGNQIWSDVYGGNALEQARCLLRSANGNGFVLAGDSYSDNIFDNHGYADFLAIEIDSVGVVKWVQNWGGTEAETMCVGVNTPEGYYAFAGSTVSGLVLSPDMDVHGNNGYADAWLIKLGRYKPGPEQPPGLIMLYPNPTSGLCYVIMPDICIDCNLHIFDMAGKLVMDKPLSGGISHVRLDEFAAGLYPWRIVRNGSQMNKGKIVLVK